jgi:hypothetical protein
LLPGSKEPRSRCIASTLGTLEIVVNSGTEFATAGNDTQATDAI